MRRLDWRGATAGLGSPDTAEGTRHVLPNVTRWPQRLLPSWRGCNRHSGDRRCPSARPGGMEAATSAERVGAPVNNRVPNRVPNSADTPSRPGDMAKPQESWGKALHVAPRSGLRARWLAERDGVGYWRANGVQVMVPESWTVPLASTWRKSAEPGRSTNRIAVATAVFELATVWCWLPSDRRL